MESLAEMWFEIKWFLCLLNLTLLSLRIRLSTSAYYKRLYGMKRLSSQSAIPVGTRSPTSWAQSLVMKSTWYRLPFTPVLWYLQKEWLSHLLWEISALNIFVFLIKDWRIVKVKLMTVTNAICPNPWLLMAVLLFPCHWLNFETYSFRAQISCD